MSVYSQGTVSIANNSNTVTGVNTFWKLIANAKVGGLITFDGETFYKIDAVVSDTELTVSKLLDGSAFTGDVVSGPYALILNPGQDFKSEIANDLAQLQIKWYNREREMLDWLTSVNQTSIITDYLGTEKNVLTVKGLNDLATALDTTGQVTITINNLDWSNISNKPSNLVDFSGSYTWTANQTFSSITLNGSDVETRFANIETVLASDDVTLDELQEIVTYIKQNRSDLDSLSISSVIGLQAALDNKLDATANAVSASKLANARTITFNGDVSGTYDFDGSLNKTVTMTVADNSHNHIISNVDGLQSALDSKGGLSTANTWTADQTLSGAGIKGHDGKPLVQMFDNDSAYIGSTVRNNLYLASINKPKWRDSTGAYWDMGLQSRTSFTTAGTGWYRVCTFSGTNSRGYYNVQIQTTGGSHSVGVLDVTLHNQYGSEGYGAIISAVAANSAYWNQVRITRENGNAYLEVYFTQQILGATLSANHNHLWQAELYSGELPIGGGTVTESLEVNKARISFFSASVKQQLRLDQNAGVYADYNNDYLLKCHNNGNITMSAAGANLYLGYQNTNKNILSADLWDNTNEELLIEKGGRLGSGILSKDHIWTGLQTFSAAGAPFAVSSTTKVTNLNADLLDGINSTGFAQLGNTGQADNYLYIRRASPNPALYVNNNGVGDIARFISGTEANSTSSTSQVTITNSGGISATGYIDSALGLKENGIAIADKYLDMSDLAVSPATTTTREQVAVAVMEQFAADQAAGKFDGTQGVFKDAAIGFLNAAFGQFNLLASDKQVTNYLSARAIEVTGRRNLINNFSAIGSTSGIDYSGELGSVVSEVTLEGLPVKTQKVTTSSNVITYSNSVEEIDHNAIYEVTLSIYSDHPDDTGTRYFGITAYGGVSAAVETISVDSWTIINSSNSNFYFWQGDVYGGNWRHMKSYVVGANVALDQIPKLTSNVHNICRLKADQTSFKLRWLNYYNSGTSVTNHFYNASCTERGVGSIAADSLTAFNITANDIRSDAVTADKIRAGAITTDKLQVGFVNEIGATDITLVSSNTAAVHINGNNISTTSSQVGTDWSEQAYSTEGYTSGIRMQCVNKTNAPRYMVGITTDPTTNASYNSIDYAWYPTGSVLEIYENGTKKAQFATGAIQSGDVLEIIYDNEKVKYLYNGTVYRTVAATANLKFYFDSSFVNDMPVEIESVKLIPLAAENNAGKTAGTVGGWSIDKDYIWTGTKQTSNAFSTSGITLSSGGGIRGKEFRIDTDGSAYFNGTLGANVVKASMIDVSDLFAQDITASGSITGATIKTAAANQRVELFDEKIRFYNNDGASWSEITAEGASNELFKIKTSSGTNRIDFYTDNNFRTTSDQAGLLSFYTSATSTTLSLAPLGKGSSSSSAFTSGFYDYTSSANTSSRMTASYMSDHGQTSVDNVSIYLHNEALGSGYSRAQIDVGQGFSMMMRDSGIHVSKNGESVLQQLYSTTTGNLYESGTPLSLIYAAKTHSHSYLPLSGGTVSGQLNIAHTNVQLNLYDTTYGDGSHFWQFDHQNGDLNLRYDGGNPAITILEEKDAYLYGALVENEKITWVSDYVVSATKILPIVYKDGNSLPNGGIYRVYCHIYGTGTDQGTTAVIWNQNGNWKVWETSRSGASSNHIKITVEGNVPSVSTFHENDYTVRIRHERILLNEEGTDNHYSMIGADGFMSNINGNLYYNQNNNIRNVYHSGYNNIGTGATNFAAGNHSHAWSSITGKPTTFTPSSHSHSWSSITGKPTTFTPSSHNHDSSYYTQADVDSFLNRGYVYHHQATNLPVGWYTIATNTGDRASARFGIWDSNSGDHQSVTFYAAHHFGTNPSNTLTVLDNSFFSGNPFRYIRIKDYGTYDGAALQVYIDDSSNNVRAAILGDNFQSSGWVLCDWIPDATTPPNVSNYASFGERSRIDLNQISQGGFATTGEIYAGHDTSQYRVFHDGYHPVADWADRVDVNTATGNANYNVLMHSGDTVYQPNGKLKINPSTGQLSVYGAISSYTHYINGDIIFRRGGNRSHIRFDGSDNSTAQGYIYKDPDVAGINVSATHLVTHSGLHTDSIRSISGQQLVLNAGESHSYATGQTAETIYLNAEKGIEVNASTDNWATGFTGAGSRKHTLKGDGLTLASNTDIFLNGNGFIKSNDTNKYIWATGSSYNWGLYWDTTNNQIQFKGAGTTRTWIDLDNGYLHANGQVRANNGISANGGSSINVSSDVSWGTNGDAAFWHTRSNSSGAHWLLASYSGGSSSNRRFGIQVLTSTTNYTTRFYQGTSYVTFSYGTITCTDVQATSALRYKNIDRRTTTAESLSLVSKIGEKGTAIGTWKPEANKGEKGTQRWLIAEDVNEIMPEVVGRDDKGRIDSLSYVHMIPDAYAAIAELDKQNKELRDEVNELKTMVKQLMRKAA